MPRCSMVRRNTYFASPSLTYDERPNKTQHHSSVGRHSAKKQLC